MRRYPGFANDRKLVEGLCARRDVLFDSIQIYANAKDAK